MPLRISTLSAISDNWPSILGRVSKSKARYTPRGNFLDKHLPEFVGGLQAGLQLAIRSFCGLLVVTASKSLRYRRGEKIRTRERAEAFDLSSGSGIAGCDQV